MGVTSSWLYLVPVKFSAHTVNTIFIKFYRKVNKGLINDGIKWYNRTSYTWFLTQHIREEFKLRSCPSKNQWLYHSETWNLDIRIRSPLVTESGIETLVSFPTTSPYAYKYFPPACWFHDGTRGLWTPGFCIFKLAQSPQSQLVSIAQKVESVSEEHGVFFCAFLHPHGPFKLFYWPNIEDACILNSGE